MDAFRERVAEAAARVAERTGTDPLDVERSMAVTTDARLERLPGAIGFGLGAMGIAAGIACIGFLTHPDTAPGDAATWTFVVVAVLLVLGSVACQLVSRSARRRRPSHELYEDAWAKLAVELWPAPRYQLWAGADAGGASYSRTEFLLAVRDGARLDGFVRHAPFTRLTL